MRVVVQTVNHASVEIDGKVISQIKRGYLLLVGFTHTDDKKVVDLMVDKIAKLRVFADENRQINLSLNDIDGEILSVSQFTLYADTKKGRRPSFVDAMSPKEANELYNYFNYMLNQITTKNVLTGVFGGDMKVLGENDGPFTIMLDSEDLWPR